MNRSKRLVAPVSDSLRFSRVLCQCCHTSRYAGGASVSAQLPPSTQHTERSSSKASVDLRLTWKAVAAELGVHPTTVANWNRGGGNLWRSSGRKSLSSWSPILASRTRDLASSMALVSVSGTEDWLPRCLVPQCDGGTIDATTKETLWDRYFTELLARMHAQTGRRSFARPEMSALTDAEHTRLMTSSHGAMGDRLAPRILPGDVEYTPQLGFMLLRGLP